MFCSFLETLHVRVFLVLHDRLPEDFLQLLGALDAVLLGAAFPRPRCFFCYHVHGTMKIVPHERGKQRGGQQHCQKENEIGHLPIGARLAELVLGKSGEVGEALAAELDGFARVVAFGTSSRRA